MTSLGYVAVSVQVLVIRIASVLCVVRKRWWITVTLLGEGMVPPVFSPPPQAGRGVSVFLSYVLGAQGYVLSLWVR